MPPVADVQVEHGHFKVANRLAEAILAAGFSTSQLHILMALLRVTYGWRRSTVKCTETQLAIWAGMQPGPDVKRASGTFRQALKLLVQEGVVRRVDGMRGSPESTFSIQKDYVKWGQYSSAEARLQSVYGVRPASDDQALRSVLRSEHTEREDHDGQNDGGHAHDSTPTPARKIEADEMAQEQAMSRTAGDSTTWPDSRPSNEGGDMARPQATSKTTWPDSGPSVGPQAGHGTGSNSLNGETYERGKTLKDSSTPLGDIDLLPQQASVSAEPRSLSAAESESRDHETPAPIRAESAREMGAETNRWSEGARGATPPALFRTDTRAPVESAAEQPDPNVIREFAIRLATAANDGIGQRWYAAAGGLNPNPLTYVTGLELASELVKLGVPIELARHTIAAVCAGSKQPKPPSHPNYFRQAIVDAFAAAEQRAFDAADSGKNVTRGGGPRPIAAVIAPRRSDQELKALQQAYDAEQRAAAATWAKDPTNRIAVAELADTITAKYANMAASKWRDMAITHDVVRESAKRAGFPTFDAWLESRGAAIATGAGAA